MEPRGPVEGDDRRHTGSDREAREPFSGKRNSEHARGRGDEEQQQGAQPRERMRVVVEREAECDGSVPNATTHIRTISSVIQKRRAGSMRVPVISNGDVVIVTSGRAVT